MTTNEMQANKIIIVPLKAEAFLPKKYGYKTTLVQWTVAVIPGKNNNNPQPWWVTDAITWKNLKDGSVWTDMLDNPIWDSTEYRNQRTGEIYHRDVRGLIGVVLARMACEVLYKHFVFEDIAKLNKMAIKRVLREVDKHDLTVALKTATEEVKRVIYENISKRMQEMIKEDLELMGPVRVRDVEDAQQKIVAVIRNLDEIGEISIGVPEVRRPHKVRTCNFRCINFERLETDGKSTTVSREEGAEDPCMWCKAKERFVDEEETRYYNQNRMKDSGELVDPYGRTYRTNGFCGPRMIAKVHKMDPDAIRQSMEQDREAEAISEVLKETNMAIIGTYLKAGHALHVENPRFVADRYGCFGETEFVESDIAVAQRIMSQEGDEEELKQAALEAIYQNMDADYAAKTTAYQQWLDRELMKEIRAVDEKFRMDIEAPTVETHVEYVVADAPVTINTLRKNLAWSEGANCPYSAYYSRRKKVGDTWYEPKFQIEPGHVSVLDKSKDYVRCVAGDVEALWDREVVEVQSHMSDGTVKVLNKRHAYGVAIDTLRRAGIKLEEVMK